MMQQHLFRKYKLNHFLFWLLVIGVWYLLRFDDYSSKEKAFRVTLLKVADLALMIYITNYLLIPGLLYKKKYLAFVIVFVLMIAGSSILKMNLIGRMTNNPLLLDFKGHWKDRIYDNILPHFFLVIAGAAAKLMFDQISLQKKMADMAREKAEAELNFLKSQINPHFLFNSLNSVYFMIDKSNTEARNLLHKFSEMLRFQLYEVKDARIPVEKEIQYLRDYVDLQRHRKDENYSITFDCSPDVRGFLIEPLLMIPFVENAFKHISHKNNGVNFINMEFFRSNGYFQFNIRNSKEERGNAVTQPGGIGLTNVKRRLELLYPGKHELNIRDSGTEYKVEFKIKL
jgi:two-component system, LytTR family, sensor kinase